ncbi:heme ABC transporter ATP-binding protein [Nocardioides sp. BP30]|uniref:heme ABC transporter ATP-binding protein n=1 Tax=Nocardioides sp. BP30 TaxID=3036374 RepID=UPI0024691B24|nr:heme ABC transporter ATP-binding protein [Nocardioides sp. BP30]WGL51695.1 heme ABC transporter ATP-binding protein [Nocardioides sp. BP30]
MGATVRVGARAIIDRISLRVGAGEMVALVGPNGAGKSTLLGVMAGDLAPTEGSVTLDGVDLAAWRPLELARRRAVLPQEHRLAFGFRAEEVVRMGRAPWERGAREDHDDAAVAAAMARTDVTHLAERVFPSLSGGEKARTSFARILAQDTELLLLDEPTAALDLRHQDQVLAESRRLATGGRAVAAIVHDLSVAAAYADRICVLSGGALVADGTPEEVLTPALLSEVYEHPVEVLRHRGRLVVVPRRLHTVPAGDRTEDPGHTGESGGSPWRAVR